MFSIFKPKSEPKADSDEKPKPLTKEEQQEKRDRLRMFMEEGENVRFRNPPLVNKNLYRSN